MLVYVGAGGYARAAGLERFLPSCVKKLESAPAQQIIHAKRKSTPVVIRKEWIKALFRAFGDSDRNKLVENLMEELAQKHLRSRTSDVDTFWSPKPSYPN